MTDRDAKNIERLTPEDEAGIFKWLANRLELLFAIKRRKEYEEREK